MQPCSKAFEICGAAFGSIAIFDNLAVPYHQCRMDAAFDPLKFYDEVKAADVSDRQARVQAEAMRNAFAVYDASKMKELPTKGDLREVELRILKWVIGVIITQTALIIAVIGIAVAILLR